MLPFIAVDEKLWWLNIVNRDKWKPYLYSRAGLSAPSQLNCVVNRDTPQTRVAHTPRLRLAKCGIKKNRKNIYRSDVQVTFEPHSHFRCCTTLFEIILHLLSTGCSTDFKLPMSFEIHWARQYLINLASLLGIVNATIYKTEPISTSLRQHRLS